MEYSLFLLMIVFLYTGKVDQAPIAVLFYMNWYWPFILMTGLGGI